MHILSLLIIRVLRDFCQKMTLHHILLEIKAFVEHHLTRKGSVIFADIYIYIYIYVCVCVCVCARACVFVKF